MNDDKETTGRDGDDFQPRSSSQPSAGTRVIAVASEIMPAALARKDAATYIALSVSTLDGLVRQGKIPPPRQLSGNRVAWLRSELDAWLLARPVSELLPPANAGAPKPRPRRL